MPSSRSTPFSNDREASSFSDRNMQNPSLGSTLTARGPSQPPSEEPPGGRVGKGRGPLSEMPKHDSRRICHSSRPSPCLLAGTCSAAQPPRLALPRLYRLLVMALSFSPLLDLVTGALRAQHSPTEETRASQSSIHPFCPVAGWLAHQAPHASATLQPSR
ncbi:hypothetical protein LX32DRAFT_243171 [Colletotrichum zoysiae]|uniref:Uncharacterized protein n=1 Tax=Colletotrichum zoysiae TaxID=1216348 RepID=A0AAD9H3R9_9PEZI|nr:hypothetical protein LX32DRAFT_243171 [Colletotrichum zoysiae]